MRVKKISVIYLIIFAAFSSCTVKTDEIIGDKTAIVLPTNEAKSDFCERFVGKWEVRFISDNEIDPKKNCEKEPCYYWLNGGTLSLTCSNGEISGKFMSKNALPEKEVEIPVNLSLEDNTLSASFKNERECLYEFQVSPKDKFLSGKYTKRNCTRKLIHETENDFIKGTKGNVLLVGDESIHDNIQ